MRSSATCSAPSRGLWTNCPLSKDGKRRTQIGVVFTFAVLIAIALWVLVWILGEVGVLIAIILTVRGLFAAFVFLSERLDRMEKKMDALSSKTEKPESDNASNHIGSDPTEQKQR